MLGEKQKMPTELVPKLLQRFWCDEGYCLYKDAVPLIRQLRESHKASDTRVLVAVITNSDDRVPDILTSLGMQISPVRYGTKFENMPATSWQDDVDFSVMSYDVGHEKPDKRIFAAAEEVLQTKLDGEGGVSEADRDPEQWRKVYVGDEYDKDVVGALEAGWNAVLIDRETTRGRKDVEWLDPKPAGDLWNTFKTSKAVGFGSLEKLAEWLPGRI